MMPTALEAPPRVVRILVVDDNEDAADGLAGVLALRGHDCRTAYDVPTAYIMALEVAPDVVLSDLAMPDLDGTDLARMIRQQGDLPQPALVAVTAYGDEDHRRAAFAAGFDQLFVKPVDVEVLLSFLEHILPPPGAEGGPPSED